MGMANKMNTYTISEVKRDLTKEFTSKKLPIRITIDNEVVAILLSKSHYNRLVMDYNASQTVKLQCGCTLAYKPSADSPLSIQHPLHSPFPKTTQ